MGKNDESDESDVNLVQVFRVKSTTDTSKTGSYQIIYTLYFEQHPETYIDFTPFTVNVVY